MDGSLDDSLYSNDDRPHGKRAFSSEAVEENLACCHTSAKPHNTAKTEADYVQQP
jgi:hypothetical protein